VGINWLNICLIFFVELKKFKEDEKPSICSHSVGLEKYRLDSAKLRNGRRIVTCPQCNKEFKRRDHLESHIRRQCKDKTFGCHNCGREFKFSGSLRLHARCHTDAPTPSYQCPKCVKCLTTLHAFKRHLRMHERDFSHLCTTCGRGFVDKVALKAHMVSHGIPQYKCEECGKPFLHERFLRCHLRLHRGECDNVCSMCGKAFTTAAVLRTHMKVHEAVKEHVCAVCSHAFTYIHSLQNHMRIHTGEKAFGCVECAIKFHTRFQFERHQRDKHGVIPRVLHICNECGKECSSVTNLATHKTSHSAEKPHRCDQCDNSYKTKYDLTKHKKKLHTGAGVESVDLNANGNF